MTKPKTLLPPKAPFVVLEGDALDQVSGGSAQAHFLPPHDPGPHLLRPLPKQPGGFGVSPPAGAGERY